MKKILSLIALAMTIGFTSCSDDSCDHVPGGPEDNWIEGLWYVEANNEEINYGNSGTYYDRYSNVELSGETEGSYEMDYANMKLTYRYLYLGKNFTEDWTVKNHKEFSFKLSSSYASGLDVEKIVEQHKVNVGETVKLNFAAERSDINVSSYKSNNELIATVSSDGIVTAMGGKGTTYIKMATNSGNVWAKITVGEDNKDLWCDYVSLIGADYNTMRQYFSRIGEPATYGIDYFVYIMSIHQYIESVNILIDTEEDLVTAIQLFIKDGVPPVEIKSYLKSRYYEQDGFGFYSTQPEIEESKAIVTYDQANRCVSLFETQHEANTEILGNYYEALGLTHDQIADKFGAPYLDENNMMYYIVGTEYVDLAAFRLDETTNKCKSTVLTINETVATSTIVDYLESKYTVFADGTAADGSQYAWTNGPSVAESTLGIMYYPEDRMVVYIPLGSAANAKARSLSSYSITIDNSLVNQVKSKNSAIYNNAKKTRKSLKLENNYIK